MSAFKTTLGDQVHCEELSTGDRNTGIFELSSESIRTELYRYDAFMRVDAKEAVYLRTCKNDIVSLHDNVPIYSGSRSRLTQDIGETYYQAITSNSAVIGPDRWTGEDRVKRCTFTFDHGGRFLRNNTLLAALHTASVGEFSNSSPLLSFENAELRVEVKHSGRHVFGLTSLTDIAPYFVLYFREPARLSKNLESVLLLCDFASLATGTVVRPLNLQISRWSAEENKDAIENGVASEWHDVHYLWSKVPESDSQSAAALPVFRAYDAEELVVLREAMLVWLSRALTWKKATSQLMAALNFNAAGTVPTMRIIDACNWLAVIPGAEPLDTGSSTLSDIQAAATERAIELGCAHLTSRIAQAIKKVGSETHEQRFLRLEAKIQARFGGKILGDRLVPDLKLAMALRNKCAHGHFSPEREAEFLDFVRSLFAVEALCFLLTVVDLPVDTAPAHRLTGYPLVRNYLLSL